VKALNTTNGEREQNMPAPCGNVKMVRYEYVGGRPSVVWTLFMVPVRASVLEIESQQGIAWTRDSGTHADEGKIPSSRDFVSAQGSRVSTTSSLARSMSDFIKKLNHGIRPSLPCSIIRVKPSDRAGVSAS